MLVTVAGTQVPVQVLSKFVGPVIAPVITLDALLELIVRLANPTTPPLTVAAAEPELIVSELPAPLVLDP